MFVDASFYIAVALSSDSYHDQAVTKSLRIHEPLVTSEDIIKETLTVISQRLGRKNAISFYDEVKSGVTILPVTSDRFQKGLEIFLTDSLQKDISLIDCITARICKELKIKKILTFDHHFHHFGLKTLP